jgi:hypothetical protein
MRTVFAQATIGRRDFPAHSMFWKSAVWNLHIQCFVVI